MIGALVLRDLMTKGPGEGQDGGREKPKQGIEIQDAHLYSKLKGRQTRDCKTGKVGMDIREKSFGTSRHLLDISLNHGY